MDSFKKILIVDDDTMSGNLLAKRLEKKGFKCEVVSTGQSCLDLMLNKNDFDLVLLDIMMPGMSGTEVLEEIRKTKNNFELPVIMVTAKDEASDVIDSLKKGANDYITKPVNIDMALARIQTQLQIKALVEESLLNKQTSTINSMVTTLNHEINNPLAIALGNLTLAKKNLSEERIEKSMRALERIADIVKKIEKITGGEIEEVSYSGEVNMFKL